MPKNNFQNNWKPKIIKGPKIQESLVTIEYINVNDNGANGAITACGKKITSLSQWFQGGDKIGPTSLLRVANLSAYHYAKVRQCTPTINVMRMGDNT